MSDRSDILVFDACAARVVDRERVAVVQDAMPSDVEVEQAADVFALLGDPRWLRAHRIVSAPRRQGRMMYYRLDDAHVRMLLDLALTHTQHTRALHPERH